MVDKVLKALLLLSPICYTVGIRLRDFDHLFFYTGMMVLFIASFFEKPKRHIDLHPIIGLLVIALCGLVWHDFAPIEIASAVNIFLAIAALKAIVEHISDVDSFAKYMVFAGLINVVVWIAQVNGLNLIIENPDGEPGGIMGNAPRLGNYLALIMPFAFSYSKLAFLLFMIMGVALKEFMVIVIGLGILFLRLRWFRPTVCILSWFGLLAGHKEIIQSFKIRWMVWEPMLFQIFQRPQQGFGFGMFPKVSDQFMPPGMLHANIAFSSFLQFLFEAGLLGGCVWLAYLTWFYRKQLRNQLVFTTDSLGVLTLILLSTVEYPFQIERLWITIIAIVAFFLFNRSRTEVQKCPSD